MTTQALEVGPLQSSDGGGTLVSMPVEEARDLEPGIGPGLVKGCRTRVCQGLRSRLIYLCGLTALFRIPALGGLHIYCSWLEFLFVNPQWPFFC